MDKNKQQIKPEHNPLLGVVVIGRNEASRLNSTLPAVLKAGFPLVYVDSRSVDDSVEVAKSKGVDVLVLSDDRPVNASRARNEGARALLSVYPELKYIQFLDGDTVLDENWLNLALQYMQQHADIGFVCGQLQEKDRDSNIYRRLCDMEWRWQETTEAEPIQLGGMGIISVEAYRKSGGYDETLIAGADPELYTRFKKAGWQLHVLPELMGIHDSGMYSFRQWWTRNVKTGFGFAHGKITGAWGRERRSACIWGGVLPVISVSAMSFNPFAICLLAAVPANILKIWLSPVKREFSPYDRFLYAAFCMLGKFPQFIGMIKFHWRQYQGKAATVIQYK